MLSVRDNRWCDGIVPYTIGIGFAILKLPSNNKRRVNKFDITKLYGGTSLIRQSRQGE